jgi:FkbM family methyltransferase
MVQVTEELVREIYRGVLGREPENDDVVREHASHGLSLAEVLRATVSCQEFMSRVRGAHFDFLGGGITPADEGIMGRHLAPAAPDPQFISNFIGARTRATLTAGTADLGGHVFQDIPTRAGDFVAEPIEYVGTIKAVEAGFGPFVMAELGAGLGTWCVNSGYLARKMGRGPIRLYAVEGSAARVENLMTNFTDNAFDPDQHFIHAAVVGDRDGYALFPQIDVLGDWGSRALFSERAEPKPGYDIVQSISIPTLLRNEQLVDLIHFDIQGVEADAITASLAFLTARVRYMVVGTHGREIEYTLLRSLKGAGWVLENEQPAKIDRANGGENLRADGTQVWRNPNIG